MRLLRAARRALAAAIVAGAAALPAAAQQPGELVVATARLALNLPLWLAQAQGFFEQEGVRVRLAGCEFGRLCLRQLLDGKADLATVADSPISFASFDGNGFAIVATLNTNRNDTKLIVRRDSGITGVPQLAGRRVGTFVGTSAHYSLDTLALFDAVNPASFTLVPLTAGDAVDALRSGKIDAAALFEPFAYAAVRSLGDAAQVVKTRRLYTQTWNLVLARRHVGTRDADVAALLRAVARAQDMIAREPARAQALLRERLGMDQAAIDWTWPDLRWSLALEQSLVTTLEAQARWAIRNGHVKARSAPDYLDFVHPAALQLAVPGAVTLRY